MGTKHSKAEIAEGALATALEGGLGQLSFGAVSQMLGINDRTVVYYFPTKIELVSEVLTSLDGALQRGFERAFPAAQPDFRSLLRGAWPVLARTDLDPLFALFFEATGLAAIGHEPYRERVAHMTEQWVGALAALLKGSSNQPRPDAEAAIAILLGLLLTRQLSGSRAANRSAKQLGITT